MDSVVAWADLFVAGVRVQLHRALAGARYHLADRGRVLQRLGLVAAHRPASLAL